jgi:hypothetical protein
MSKVLQRTGDAPERSTEAWSPAGGVRLAIHDVLQSSGEPLQPPARRFMESRFDQDFTHVRVHADPLAAQSARSMNALAYTVGHHIVLGPARAAPASPAGSRLLAHELAHVVQAQGASCWGSPPDTTDAPSRPGDPSEVEADRAAALVVDGADARPRLALHRRPARIYRAVEPVAPLPAARATGLIREDEAPAATPGQMAKGAFLQLLHDALCQTVIASFEGSPYEGRGCPFVERAIGFYRRQPAASVEASIRRYAPEAASAASAQDYVGIVARRVRGAVDSFVRTGRITGIPAELEPLATMGPLEAAGEIGNLLGRTIGTIGGAIAGAASAVGHAIGGAITGIGNALRALFKRRAEPAGGTIDAHAVRRGLGRGSELRPDVRTRLEGVFGQDFSGVRVHTDERAAGMTESLGARALTVGSDVAFARGEYRPGTVTGDALIAHELAHTVQQQAPETQGAPEQGLEVEADESAVEAVAELWFDRRRKKPKKRPRQRAGLRLQRCAGSQPSARVATPAAQCAAIDPARWRQDARAARDSTATPAQQAQRMFALVAQALCGLGPNVHMAGESHTDVEDPADYVPIEQGVNFDARLNTKQRHGGGSALTHNAGHSFSAGRNRYVVLGPLTIDPQRPENVRFIYEHELFHAEHHLTPEHRRAEAAAIRALPEAERQGARQRESAGDEVEAYSAQFPSYFHVLGSIGRKPDGTIGYAGELWTALVQNYDQAGSDKQDLAFNAMTTYYRQAAADRQNLFVEWLRLVHRRNSGSQLVQRLATALGIDVTVAPQRWRP